VILYINMKRLQQRKMRKFLHSWWVILFLCLLAIFSVRQVYDVYTKYRESRDNLDTIEKEYEVTREREEKLQRDISELHSEDGVDKEIREKFSVVKEGEKVLVINGGDMQEEEVEIERGFFGKIKNGLYNLFR